MTKETRAFVKDIIERRTKKCPAGEADREIEYLGIAIDELKEELKESRGISRVRSDLISAMEDDLGRAGLILKNAYAMAVDINAREITHVRFEPLLELLTPDDQK